MKLLIRVCCQPHLHLHLPLPLGLRLRLTSARVGQTSRVLGESQKLDVCVDDIGV